MTKPQVVAVVKCIMSKEEMMCMDCIFKAGCDELHSVISGLLNKE